MAGRRLQRPSCAAWNVQSAIPYSLSMSPCEEACSEPLYPAFITGTAVLTSKSSGMTVTSEPADWAPGGRRCCSELKASGGGTSDDAVSGFAGPPADSGMCPSCSGVVSGGTITRFMPRCWRSPNAQDLHTCFPPSVVQSST